METHTHPRDKSGGTGMETHTHPRDKSGGLIYSTEVLFLFKSEMNLGGTTRVVGEKSSEVGVLGDTSGIIMYDKEDVDSTDECWL